MLAAALHFWKKTPFLRLLLPLIAGILVQWYFQPDIRTCWILLAFSFLFLTAFFFIPFFRRYQLSGWAGIVTALLFFCLGAALSWQRDIRNNSNWIKNKYSPGDALVAQFDEPLTEKTKSIKVNATVSHIIRRGTAIAVKGKIIVYFKKDSLPAVLGYGSKIIFRKALQEIKNTGNPGGFNYKRYCLFHDITQQVYLQPGEYEILPEKTGGKLQQFIFSSREKILKILRNNIQGEKELGLAEALLIGYKNDLDKTLVQSYTNTGVVHIIAISGLHLGLIYWLLAQLLKPFRRTKKTRWLSPLLIIAGLWLFSLLAGAQPSILRSALMFTCIVIGESLDRKTSIFNTMAVSAFILLCINPFLLWDVGFQLSYAAVSSIIIFMRPVYNWFYIRNRLLDLLWKLNAVTIAAQVLTIPLSIYHFHQFPSWFLLTNFIAVPLSSVILLGEILLCVISFIPAIASFTGNLLSWLIRVMNTYVERVEVLPFYLLDSIQISVIQAVLLLLFLAGLAWWLMEKSTGGLLAGLMALLFFMATRSFHLIRANNQQIVIVYNVPQQQAIDFINGRNYFFVGDSGLVTDDFNRKFHLNPSRILYRAVAGEQPAGMEFYENHIRFNDKHILLLDKPVSYSSLENKPVIDLLIISKNPKIFIRQMAGSLVIKQIVFDGSVPAWKTRYWKKDCDSLHIPWYDVTTHGAFVMNL